MATTKDICKPFIDKVRQEERKKYKQRIKKLDKLIDWDKKTEDLIAIARADERKKVLKEIDYILEKHDFEQSGITLEERLETLKSNL